MSLVDKNPLITSRPEPPKRPQQKINRVVIQRPMAREAVSNNKDESFFAGRQSMPAHEIGESLRSDSKVRNYFKQELGLGSDSKVDSEIKKIEEKLSKSAGGHITKSGIEKMIADEYWNEKRDLNEKMKGGITNEEIEELNRNKKINLFLKNKFGIK